MSAEILKRVAETVAEGEKTGLSEKLVLEAVRSVRPCLDLVNLSTFNAVSLSAY